jgi:hypothetical protein
MKISKLAVFTMLAAGVFTFSACDELREAANVDVDTNFSETFSFSATVPTDPLTGEASFAESGSIDLNESEAADYVDKIQDIEIKSVTMTVESYTGTEGATISGAIDLGGGFNLPIDNVQLQSLFDSGEALDLTDNAGSFNYLRNQLKDQKQLSYNVNVNISEVPVSTTIRFNYKVVVTANALD